MSKATAEESTRLEALKFNAIVGFVFLLFVFGVSIFLHSYSMKQDRIAGVQDTYREAINLLSRNADNESADYRSTLKSYVSCIALAGSKRTTFLEDNENFNFTSSTAFAKLRLPLDLKVCQEKVIKEATDSIGPGADASKITQQMTAVIANANSYLYTPDAPKAFLSK